MDIITINMDVCDGNHMAGKKKKSAYFVCVQISLSIMAAVVMLPVSGSILNKPLMDDDLIE